MPPSCSPWATTPTGRSRRSSSSSASTLRLPRSERLTDMYAPASSRSQPGRVASARTTGNGVPDGRAAGRLQRGDAVATARRAISRGDRPTYRLERTSQHEFRVLDFEHSIIAYDAAAALRAANEWIAFLLDVPDGSFDVRLQVSQGGRYRRIRRPEVLA